MTTDFQLRLSTDLQTIRQLLVLMHPDLDVDDAKLHSMTGKGSYTWVQVQGQVKGFGYVGININNMENDVLTGRQPDSAFTNHQKDLKFSMWRSAIDVRYNPAVSIGDFIEGEGEFMYSESYLLRPAYTKILLDAGYSTASASEWMKYYRSD